MMMVTKLQDRYNYCTTMQKTVRFGHILIEELERTGKKVYRLRRKSSAETDDKERGS